MTTKTTTKQAKNATTDQLLTLAKVKTATKETLTILCKGHKDYRKSMAKKALQDLALIIINAKAAEDKLNPQTATKKASPEKAPTEATTETPTEFNVPKDHLFCAVCKTHQLAKTMDKMTVQGQGMCKKLAECEARKIQNTVKKPTSAKAKAASSNAVQNRAAKASGDYSAKTGKKHLYRAGTKMAKMVDALTSKSGATLADLADLVDTSEVNVRHRVTYMMPRAGYNVVANTATSPVVFNITS